MDFRLSGDHLALRQAARDFLESECTPQVVRAAFDSQDGAAPDLYKKMAELGWLALTVPESSGGLGLGLVEQAVLLEQLGYYGAPGPYFSTAALTIPLLISVDAVDLVQQVIEGGLIASAVIDADFVVDGQLADAFIVDRGDSLNWVPASDAEVIPHTTVDGTRRTATVRIPEGAGRKIGKAENVESVVNGAAALISAESVGGMQRILDKTVEYTKVRTQFGREIGSFQTLKHRLADVLLLVESSRSAAYYAAWSMGFGTDDAAYSASVAKAFVSDAYLKVAGEGIQIHGGIGYTWEHDAHLWLKRALMNAELLGSAEYHRSRVLELSGLADSQ